MKNFNCKDYDDPNLELKLRQSEDFMKKSSENKENLLFHYDSLFDGHATVDAESNSYKILDWESRDDQYSRFAILTECVDLRNKSILDVGCGLGDLYCFLNKMSMSSEYVGIDVSEKMINWCRCKYPQVRFECVDLLFSDDYFEDRVFDVVFASGIFNLNTGHNLEILSTSLAIFYKLSKKYVVFNLLNETSPDKEPSYYYYSPSDIVEMLKIYPYKQIRVVEDYLLNDFTVICEK